MSYCAAPVSLSSCGTGFFDVMTVVDTFVRMTAFFGVRIGPKMTRPTVPFCITSNRIALSPPPPATCACGAFPALACNVVLTSFV